MVVKTLHLKLLPVYRTESHRRILEFLDILEAGNTNGLLKKGNQELLMSKDDTGDAKFQGREALFMSKGDTGKAKI